MHALLLIVTAFSVLFPQNQLLPKFEETALIIENTAYTINYIEEHEQPSWVYYNLIGTNMSGSAKRKNNFRPDSRIITGSATLNDYKGSGYDRGHLAPAAIFKWSDKTMSESFYMSNMSPQVPGFNRGIWKKLESLIRKWAISYNELFVITGPILEPNLPTIGENKVSVPKYYYKVGE